MSIDSDNVTLQMILLLLWLNLFPVEGFIWIFSQTDPRQAFSEEKPDLNFRISFCCISAFCYCRKFENKNFMSPSVGLCCLRILTAIFF